MKMNISKLLTTCIDDMAKEIDFFSADRLMFRILDVICDMINKGEQTQEIAGAVVVMKKRNVTPSAFRTAFEKACAASGKYDQYTALYCYDNFIDEAESVARDERCPEIDLSHALEALFKKPSNNVRDAKRMLPAGGTVSTATDVTENAAEVTDSSPSAPSSDSPASAVKDGGCAKTDRISDIIAKTKEIRAKLSDRVLGQDYAINVLAEGYFSAELNDVISTRDAKPKASFLFAGSSGVGKTFLAEQFAKVLDLPFLRVDMSGFSDKEAATEFAGSDAVYRGAQSGLVTSFVAKNPKCIILFDEIEKAHLTIIHLFLQILDAGTLHDRKTDVDVSFKDAIIIFTTNAGKQLYEDPERSDFSTESRKVILGALSKDINPITNEPYFPAAICSRFASGRVVMFNRLDTSILLGIGKKVLMKKVQVYSEKTGVRVRVDENVFSAIMFAEGGNADARMITSQAKAFFDNEMLELLRLISSGRAECSYDKLKEIVFSADVEHAGEDIRALYRKASGANVLVFTSKAVAEELKTRTAGADFNLLCADSQSAAEEILSSTDVDLVMVDIAFGKRTGDSALLNIEDEQSSARDFFRYIKEKFISLPVHLIETGARRFNNEERQSFVKMGVKSIVSLDGKENLAEKIGAICTEMFCRNNMRELARTNKFVSYETAQYVSDDGETAYITLFDFRKETSVDAEDSDTVLGKIQVPNVKFDEVYGARDAKDELQYFVEYLKNPKKYVSTGVKAPKGVLLYGPPGTGKTMLAKAVAAASGVTFISTEGNVFLTSGKNGGIKGVHDIFATARKYAPSVLFIDEIDAIGKERTGYGQDDILTAFLTEMDGFRVDISRPVFVLAATNFMIEPGYAKSLDAALLRRFDRRILVDLPGTEDRKQYLADKISENKTFEVTCEKIESIAMRSVGMSLASLSSMLELAIRSSIRKGTFKVDDAILDEAFETFNYGESKKWDESVLERVAVHEAGHTLISFLGGEKPTYVTVIARGSHGGYMQHETRENKPIYTREEILDGIRTSLGGRAAELVWFGNEDGMSTGASGDLDAATRKALAMICHYGMQETFGLATLSVENAQNGTLSPAVRQAVNEILVSELENAVNLIKANRHLIEKLVDELIRNNSLTAKDIERILG